MAQAFLHYLGMDALPEHEAGVGVSEVVKPDTGEPCPLRYLGKGVSQTVRQERGTVRLCEYQLGIL